MPVRDLENLDELRNMDIHILPEMNNIEFEADEEQPLYDGVLIIWIDNTHQ